MRDVTVVGRVASGARFGLFAECLLVGVLVTVVALPVVTLLPALAAGCAQIRAHVDGESTALRAFLRRVAVAFPGSLRWSLAAVAGFAVLAADVLIVRAGVPGARPVTVVCALAAVALAVVLLRAAAGWRPGANWGELVRGAARRAGVDDLSGSLLLAMGIGVLVVVTWQLAPLAVPMTGCVVMAAVAVERRRHPPAEPPMVDSNG